MEALNKLFTEKQVVELSEKIMAATRDGIKEQIANKFYEETEGWLYEIYQNNKGKIIDELISEITEQYIKDPAQNKFFNLRRKIWEENKSEILPTLTDEVIANNMLTVLMRYTSNAYYFNWQWKDAIVSLIMSNWDKFKDDERIINQFGEEIQRLKIQISYLKTKLEESSFELLNKINGDES